LSLDAILDSTFWQLKIAITGRAQRDADLAAASGWWAERFAREKALSPLSHYLSLDGDGEIDEAEALRSWAQGIDARFKRT